MAEVTECTAADEAEFWQDTPQDVTAFVLEVEQAETDKGAWRRWIFQGKEGAVMGARVRVSAYGAAWRPGLRRWGAGWACTATDHELPRGRGRVLRSEWREGWSLSEAADAGRAHLAEFHETDGVNP